MATIITNNIPRDVIDAWELSPEDRAEFDYLDWEAIERGEDSASFVRYRDELIDLNDLDSSAPGSTFPSLSEFAGWHGYRSDSFYSGLLFRYVDDYERVIVGRYYTIN